MAKPGRHSAHLQPEDRDIRGKAVKYDPEDEPAERSRHSRGAASRIKRNAKNARQGDHKR